MKTIFSLVFTLLFTVIAHGQDRYDDYVTEISGLKDLPEVKAYWTSVRSADQRYRGANTIDSNDCNNLVKVAVLIEKFGYPDPETYGAELAFTPVLVMAHQTSMKATEITVPFLYHAYRQNFIPLDKMLYCLGGMHQSKFGQYFDRDRGPHKYDPKDVSRLVERLQLDTTIHQQKELIDLLRREKADRQNDRSLQVVGRWRTKQNDKYICFQKNNHYVLKLLHPDHSYSEPVVTLRPEKGETIIEYSPSFYGDYFKINAAGNLEYYEKDVMKTEFLKL